jgi:hypothetical protein
MKVAVINANAKQEKPFPKLMVTNEGKVVLFSENKKGMVINAIESHGEINGECYHCWDMSMFTDFEGSVTLSND